jgi:hypothetical protein
MRRREFIAGLGSIAAAYPIMPRAQQLAMPAIGYLGVGDPFFTTQFNRGLAEQGYVDGRNAEILYRRVGQGVIGPRGLPNGPRWLPTWYVVGSQCLWPPPPEPHWAQNR